MQQPRNGSPDDLRQKIAQILRRGPWQAICHLPSEMSLNRGMSYYPPLMGSRCTGESHRHLRLVGYKVDPEDRHDVGYSQVRVEFIFEGDVTCVLDVVMLLEGGAAVAFVKLRMPDFTGGVPHGSPDDMDVELVLERCV